LSIELVTQFKVFDFATKFAGENPSIATPEEFTVTDDIYQQFKDFVKASDFHYDTQSQADLETLMETAKQEKYMGLAKAEFEALKAKLEPNLDKDLKEFRDEISELIEDEIVARYYYQKGAIRAAIHDDEGISETIDALHSETAYAAYFQPGTIISMN